MNIDNGLIKNTKKHDIQNATIIIITKLNGKLCVVYPVGTASNISPKMSGMVSLSARSVFSSLSSPVWMIFSEIFFYTELLS